MFLTALLYRTLVHLGATHCNSPTSHNYLYINIIGVDRVIARFRDEQRVFIADKLLAEIIEVFELEVRCEDVYRRRARRLTWTDDAQGLSVNLPETAPSQHALTLKIHGLPTT